MTPNPTEINVMATAAFKAAYVELMPQFERATGNKVITTWPAPTTSSRASPRA